MKQIAATALVLALAAAPAALAQETIQTHTGQNPGAEAPVAANASAGPDRDRRQADGDWARRVMAGQSTATDEADYDEADARGCHRNPDRNPHGEVWAGIGTGGYNTVGAVVTQPIGDCGEVTVAISRTEGGRIHRGRR
jgi:hypothetical protein